MVAGCVILARRFQFAMAPARVGEEAVRPLQRLQLTQQARGLVRAISSEVWPQKGQDKIASLIRYLRSLVPEGERSLVRGRGRPEPTPSYSS